MTSKTEHSFDLAQCMVHKSGFGVDYIYNVCADTVKQVPWGAVDWMLHGLLALSVLATGVILFGCFKLLTFK